MSIHFGGFNLKSATDCYGFEKDESLVEEEYEEFVSEYLPTLAKRSQRWQKIYHSKSDGRLPRGIFADRKVKRFIRKGIPASLRPKIWMQISGADEAMRANPGKFESLSRTVLSEEVIRAIDLDLNRTFPDNIYFKQRPDSSTKQLKLILKAFAANHSNVGYCQGLNFICAMFYLILKNAESSYWLLESVVCTLPDNFYDSTMQGLQTEIEICNQILQQFEPDITLVFQRTGADLSMFTSKWFVCWFLETLPIETVLRIWDCFFNEGHAVLIKVALTLLIRNKDQFLKCRSLNHVADVMKSIVSDSFALHCHSLLQETFQLAKPIKRAVQELCTKAVP